jgi:hypothetical protein
MYNDLLWWLLIITPAVLSITCFIWRMESRGSCSVYSQRQDDGNGKYRDEAPLPAIDAAPIGQLGQPHSR